MEETKEIFYKYKKLLITSCVAVIFALSGIIIYGTGYSYEVVLNDEIVAYVHNEASVQYLIDELEVKADDVYGEKAYLDYELVINKVRGFTEQEIGEETLSDVLQSKIDVYKVSSVITIDGEEVIAVDNPTIAKYVLEDLLKPYKNDIDGYKVIDANFQQEVDFIEKDTLVDEILDYDSAMLFFTNKEAAEQSPQIARLSSDLEDVTVASLDVVATVEIVEDESIDFEVSEVKDDSIYVGEKKVKQKGVLGNKQLTYNATYVNGEYTHKDLVSEAVTLEPVEQIVLIGTKQYVYSSGPGGSANGNSVVAEAKSLVGRAPYVFGGNTPAGFDCSGFTQWVFAKGGVNLPHSAAGQARYGSSVSRSELQVGDLLIFRGQTGSSIGHTGLYVGGGMMIHSPIPGRTVEYASVDSAYFSSRFITGRTFK